MPTSVSRSRVVRTEPGVDRDLWAEHIDHTITVLAEGLDRFEVTLTPLTQRIVCRERGIGVDRHQVAEELEVTTLLVTVVAGA